MHQFELVGGKRASRVGLPARQPFDEYPRTGHGSEQVCPTTTTTYEIRVLFRDGQTTVQQVTITVNPVVAQNPLANTAWEVISYNNGREAVTSVLAGTRLTANFDAGGMVNGNAGCNDYFGSYQVSGNTIAIGTLGSGQMACADPEGVMQQESEYLAALQSAATYRLDGDKLELRTAGGAIAASFSHVQ